MDELSGGPRLEDTLAALDKVQLAEKLHRLYSQSLYTLSPGPFRHRTSPVRAIIPVRRISQASSQQQAPRSRC